MAERCHTATKAGLLGTVKIWALELGEHGIAANTVGPGPTEDVANAVSFLLDARGGFVTGQALHVCGGTTARAAGA